MKFKLTLFILFLVLIPSVIALDLWVRPKDASGNLMVNYPFTYRFGFSRNDDCTDIFFNHTESITTDESGVAYIYIPTNNISDYPLVLCEYRDSSLRAVHNFSDLILRSLQVQTINVTNITAERTWTDYIGDAMRRVIQGFFVDIQSEEINATNIISIYINATNITASDTGHFRFLGSAARYIQKIWATYIQADELNATNITAIDVNATTGAFVNISATGYIEGQPIDGSIGSGVISSDENKLACGCINITENETHVTYPAHEGRIWNLDLSTTYCNLSKYNVIPTDDQHSVYYVDSSCALQSDTWTNYFSQNINPANYYRLFDVYKINGEIELIKGTSLIGILDRKIKWNSVNCKEGAGHLTVCGGISIEEGTFPYFNQTSGSFIYVATEHTSAEKQTDVNGIHFVTYEGGNLKHINQTGMNLTHCTDGTDTAVCSSALWYRHYIYTIGFGVVNTQLHELAPRDGEYFTSKAECMNFQDNPHTYIIPDLDTGVAVIHHVYCGRKGDTNWNDAAWHDMRDETKISGAGEDTSDFMRYSGWSGNADAGGYTLYNVNINGTWNESVNYYTIIEIDSHILNNITSLNESVKGWVFNGSFYLTTEIDEHIVNNITSLNESVKLWAYNGSFYLTTEVDEHILNNITALNESIKEWYYAITSRWNRDNFSSAISGYTNITYDAELDNGSIIRSHNKTWITDNQEYWNDTHIQASELNVTGDATFDDNIFGRFIGSINRWWDKIWVKNATIEIGNVTGTLYLREEIVNTTSELDGRYFTQSQIDNATIVRNINTSWITDNQAYFDPSTIDYINQSMFDNGTIIRVGNTTWITNNQVYFDPSVLDYVNHTQLDNSTIIRTGNISWIRLNQLVNTTDDIWAAISNQTWDSRIDALNASTVKVDWDNVTYDAELTVYEKIVDAFKQGNFTAMYYAITSRWNRDNFSEAISGYTNITYDAELDNGSIVRSHNTSWIDIRLDNGSIIRSHNTSWFLNPLDNSTIIRVGNRTWVAETMENGSIVRSYNISWITDNQAYWNDTHIQASELNVTGDATFDDNIFGRFIGSINRWWDNIWVKNINATNTTTDYLWRSTPSNPFNTTTELDTRYFTQAQIDNDTIVRSHNTSWVDNLIDARVVEAFLTDILNSVYAKITVLAGLDIVNQSMLDNGSIVRSHNTSWITDNVDLSTYLQNGTDANFRRLNVSTIEVLNITSEIITYAQTSLTLHFTDVPADLNVMQVVGTPRYASIYRYDISSVPSGAAIASVTFCSNAGTKTGSPDDDLTVERIVNQTWDETVSCAEVQAFTYDNNEAENWDTIPDNSIGCVDLTAQFNADYGVGNSYFSFWLEDPDSAVDLSSCSTIADDNDLEVGGLSNRVNLLSREAAAIDATLEHNLTIIYTPADTTKTVNINVDNVVFHGNINATGCICYNAGEVGYTCLGTCN